ncbi:MAG: energy transducer TonB [Bacteroidetes bacterium]|nr:energy transducer TonB [Bacteroidota bacterium]
MFENWQQRYRKNFTTGIIISVLAHCIVLFSIRFLPEISGREIQREYINTYTAKMKFINIGEIIPGGGSFGNMIDETGNGGVTSQTISGTPIPSMDSTLIAFGKETNLLDQKDSLKISDAGTGKGTGGIGGGVGKGYGYGSGLGKDYTPLPFVPRQILEVIPQNVEGANGEIVLLLKIGIDGIVKEYKVVMNTTGDSEVLKHVLEAAYKSRWEKIKMDGRQVEYWIEKTYRYN